MLLSLDGRMFKLNQRPSAEPIGRYYQFQSLIASLQAEISDLSANNRVLNLERQGASSQVVAFVAERAMLRDHNQGLLDQVTALQMQLESKNHRELQLQKEVIIVHFAFFSCM